MRLVIVTKRVPHDSMVYSICGLHNFRRVPSGPEQTHHFGRSDVRNMVVFSLDLV